MLFAMTMQHILGVGNAQASGDSIVQPIVSSPSKNDAKRAAKALMPNNFCDMAVCQTDKKALAFDN